MMEIYEPQIPVGETYSKVLTSIPLSFKAERKRKWQNANEQPTHNKRNTRYRQQPHKHSFVIFESSNKSKGTS